ncbi:hypothetical protein VOLCADRAFT_93192 [Volvox carteri f. nagariensis]|uniref:histone acetyltransferase n=1 Tax=Volvox carteri f. nagariensis TaxID=3068 RepID=D8U1J0_VOLCA|nr:uncharacterized protein VOLCADRAFT_93192 [Volvox carteri f. nagariensis]EFJ46419.1 hypothetical protein VOLCADRAFT_93192 [Volvox carteri f. nagariensis]|eukprot:XP_002952572.1 hypothetical protein VOLCADRAFT_93192 [Volvox carteri f. nagariensis]
MEPEQGQPQPKRVRLSDAQLQPQGASIIGIQGALTAGPSSTTGTTVALKPSSGGLSQLTTATKPAGSIASSAAPAGQTSSVGPAVPLAAPTVGPLTAEIAAGGHRVTVEFLHQHFGDSEQIRGYSGLNITIWIHVRTYHTWVDIQFAAKRPGADKLGPIFDGAFPSGYCRSKIYGDRLVATACIVAEEFVAAATAGAAAMPDLMTLGDHVGTVLLPPNAYGITARPAAGTAGSDAAADTPGISISQNRGSAQGPMEVSVRRFQVSKAPAEVKALHARLEPLLLFTIDGAQFIDDEDPQWEMLLPVMRAEDGGCLVLGLTTLFNFFSYPASCRLRVSQVLVLSPWQGLGLGKALLKLSYDLAKSRRCADLTVEDPTPNLQRVREKLEVEMMRALPWVVNQARKCLDAVVRGETSWPVWEEEEEQKMAEEEQAAETAQQLQQIAAAGATEATPPAQGAGQGVGELVVAQQPLLAAHAFFAALGAVPPQHMVLPEDVQVKARAEAEARWRQRLAATEDAAVKAVATEAVVGPGPSGCSEDTTVVAGRGSSTGDMTGRGGVSSVAGALNPSPTFVSAISRELKMHRGQIRNVWEALLWCEPGALTRHGVRAAVEQLITSRLEAQYFSSVGRAAAAKRLVDTNRTTLQAAGSADADVDDAVREPDFFLYRPVGQEAVARAGSGDTGAVATGRLNLTQVTADDKARRMEEMLLERRQQLEALALVLDRDSKKQL